MFALQERVVNIIRKLGALSALQRRDVEAFMDGLPRVFKVRINYDDPLITAGIPIYTPEVGDVMLDFWFHAVEPWVTPTDSPKGGVGQFENGSESLYYDTIHGPFEPDVPWDTAYGGLTPYFGSGTHYNASFASLAGAGTYGSNNVPVPYIFTSISPLKVVINTEGTSEGNDCEATAGMGWAYFVIVKPIILEG